METIAGIILTSIGVIFFSYNWGFSDGIAAELEKEVLKILKTGKLSSLEIYDLLNTDRTFEIGLGQLYVGLNRLEKKGLINWEYESSDGHFKRYYRLIHDEINLEQTVNKGFDLQ